MSEGEYFNQSPYITQFLFKSSSSVAQLKRQHPIFQVNSCVSYMSFYLISGFVSHQAVARTAGNVLIRLADSLVLPLNCSDYAESLEDYLNTAVTLYQNELQTRNISMGKYKTINV